MDGDFAEVVGALRQLVVDASAAEDMPKGVIVVELEDFDEEEEDEVELESREGQAEDEVRG